jgi:hypothetical protein
MSLTLARKARSPSPFWARDQIGMQPSWRYKFASSDLLLDWLALAASQPHLSNVGAHISAKREV